MSIAAIIARYGLPALFLGAGLEGETVVVVGGVLAHKGLVSLPGAMVAASVGSCVVDQIYFLIGRRLSDWRFVRRLKHNALYARATRMLEHHPIGFVFVFRFIYGFRTISPFAIGTSDVQARLFVMVNIAAAMVWACSFTLIGYAFGREAEKLLARLQPSPTTIAIAVGLVIALGVAIHFGSRWWTKRSDDQR